MYYSRVKLARKSYREPPKVTDKFEHEIVLQKGESCKDFYKEPLKVMEKFEHEIVLHWGESCKNFYKEPLKVTDKFEHDITIEKRELQRFLKRATKSDKQV